MIKTVGVKKDIYHLVATHARIQAKACPIFQMAQNYCHFISCSLLGQTSLFLPCFLTLELPMSSSY